MAPAVSGIEVPTTLTRRALGAHTGKATPGTPSRVAGCAPSFSWAWWCVPSAIEMPIEIAQQRLEAVGVVDLGDSVHEPVEGDRIKHF